MWVPVLWSKELGSEPVRVVYWGTPAVVFRTESGKVHALADACPHRRVSLSRGQVVGETIRCGFHFLQFDGEGRCAVVPEALQAGDDYKSQCSAFRFFVRETRGVIWLSVENQPAALTPEAAFGNPNRPLEGTTFDLEGELLPWIDHFVDHCHLVYTHFRSVYTGKRGSPPAAEYKPGPGPKLSYPFRIGTLRLPGSTYKSWLVYLGLAGGVSNFIRRLWTPAAESELLIDFDQLSPICQRFHVSLSNRFGTGVVDYLSLANPVSPKKCRFWQFSTVHPESAWPLSYLLRRLAKKVGRDEHFFREDIPFISSADSGDLEKMRLAPADDLLLRARGLLQEYHRAKGALYPPDSLLHLAASGSPGVPLA